MIKLRKISDSLNAIDLKKIVKTEIQNIDPVLLPLQQGLSFSSYVSKTPFSAVILDIKEETHYINIKAGIFYTGIIAGCSCSDDPSPVDEQNEYCDLQFYINKKTYETTVSLIED